MRVSCKAHGLLDQRFFRLAQDILMRFARNHLAADFKKSGDRKRRYTFKPLENDMSLDALQHLGQSLDVEEARAGVLVSRAQENVVRLVLAQDVIDEVRGKRHLPARLLARNGAPFDQARDD